MMSNKQFHTYKALVVSVYDADTVRLDIDLGFGIFMSNEPVRLFGINAPEVRGVERPEGLISRDFLRELILGKNIVIETIKDKKGKYGRYLAKINYNGVSVNDLLVTKGMAIYKDY